MPEGYPQQGVPQVHSWALGALRWAALAAARAADHQQVIAEAQQASIGLQTRQTVAQENLAASIDTHTERIGAVLQALAPQYPPPAAGQPPVPMEQRVGHMLRAAYIRQGQPSRPKEVVIQPFSSNKPEYWRTWVRNNFLQAVELNGWDDARAKRVLPTLFTGQYAHLVSHVDVNRTIPNEQNRPITLQELIDDYTNVITPGSQSDLAKTTLGTITQRDQEELGVFFARLKTVFERAYPDIDMNQPLARDMIIPNAIRGLNKSEIRVRCQAHLAEFADLEDLRAFAETQNAALLREAINTGKYNPERGINSVQKPADNRGRRAPRNQKDQRPSPSSRSKRPRKGDPSPKKDFCNYCKKPGHIEKNCYHKQNRPAKKGVNSMEGTAGSSGNQ